jgi:hypothetical protein
MNLAARGEELFLEHQGQGIRLDGRDRLLVAKLTPLGRKVHFVNKGKRLRLARSDDPEGLILREWSKLPPREWAFPVPVEMPALVSCLPK